jgi:hypothetical protein
MSDMVLQWAEHPVTFKQCLRCKKKKVFFVDPSAKIVLFLYHILLAVYEFNCTSLSFYLCTVLHFLFHFANLLPHKLK